MHYESIKAFENDTRAPQRGDTIQASCGKAVWFYKGGSRWDLLTETFLDLSPLQKFMGRRASRCDCPTNSDEPRDWHVLECAVFDPPNKVFMPKMYGMDYDFDWVPPVPSPEKSPQEKALEDFIAKRKAKREKQVEPGMIGQAPQSEHQWKTERALDRAMRRLGFHEQDIHTRLMPYRREE